MCNIDRFWTVAGLVLAAALILCGGQMAAARDITVTKDLKGAIVRVQAGDHIYLSAGSYAGPLLLTRPVEITGGPGVVIRGNGVGNVITVKSPGVILSGLTITGSGLLLETQDSGIFLSKGATGAIVEDCHILNNLIGVYIWGAKGAVVRNNIIRGRQDMHVNERGNGVQVWNAPGAIVDGNDIQYGRDGIFVTTSRKNIFRNNNFHDVRFAVHYMYTNNSKVINNVSTGNDIGYAIMFSTHVDVVNNKSVNDRDRGILFNYANHTKILGNEVTGGPERCIFIYNSNKNIIRGNLFRGCDIGVQFTAGSEDNVITGNAFIGNRMQVKYVGTRWLDWSQNGRGNYWSDNSAFDMDGDGIADNIYRPNDLTDQILWRYPSARLLINSPAVKILKWAQSAFPALHPGGVIDSAPLMKIPQNMRVGQ